MLPAVRCSVLPGSLGHCSTHRLVAKAPRTLRPRLWHSRAPASQPAARPARAARKVLASAQGGSELRQALQLSKEEAVNLGHTTREPEHLLLGVLRAAGGGAAILVGAGIALAKARAAVKALPILNDVEKDGGSELTLSPECRAILEFNIENKLTLDRQGRGLLMLARLLMEERIARFLESLGVDPVMLLAEVVTAFGTRVNQHAICKLIQGWKLARSGFPKKPSPGSITALEEYAVSERLQRAQELLSRLPAAVLSTSYDGAELASLFSHDRGFDLTSSRQANPLLMAAEAGDASTVHALLTAGADDVNEPGPRGTTALHLAVGSGSLEVVQALLAAGANPCAQDYKGDAPLHLAAFLGRRHLVQPLVAAGSDLDALNNWNSSPLSAACEAGCIEVVQALLACGATVDSKGGDGKTPLMVAAAVGPAPVVEALLRAGADANAKSFEGKTPLLCAAGLGSVECGRALLEAGADVNATMTELLSSPLHLAAAQGHSHFVKLLLAAGASVTATNAWGGTPLHAAAMNGQVGAVKELLQAGANVIATTEKGLTPLEVAEAYHQQATVEVLEEAERASPEAQERKKKADLMEVMQWLVGSDSDDDSDSSDEAGCDQPSTGTAGGSAGNIPADSLARFIASWTLVRAAVCGDWTGDLVRRHALPNPKDMANLNAKSMGDGGMTFLHVAAEQGNAGVVEALVECGVDPNVCDGTADRRHPIHHACQEGHVKVVETLLRLGASTEARDAQGYTCLATAAEWGRVEVVRALLAQGADVSATNTRGMPVLMAACAYDQRRMDAQDKAAVVRQLLEAGADPAARAVGSNWPITGATALHVAAQLGNVGAIEVLMESGRVNIEAATEEGCRPLHQAAGFDEESSPNALLALLDLGADISATVPGGMTALHLAARRDVPQVIDLLAAAGADLAAQDEDGNTALHLAVIRDNIDSVLALLEAGAPVGAVNTAGRTPQGEARSRGQGHLVTLLQRYRSGRHQA